MAWLGLVWLRLIPIDIHQAIQLPWRSADRRQSAPGVSHVVNFPRSMKGYMSIDLVFSLALLSATLILHFHSLSHRSGRALYSPNLRLQPPMKLPRVPLPYKTSQSPLYYPQPLTHSKLLPPLNLHRPPLKLSFPNVSKHLLSSFHSHLSIFILPFSTRALCISKAFQSKCGSWPQPLRKHSKSALSK